MTNGQSYRYQVAAVVNGGEPARSALLTVDVGIDYDSDADNLIEIDNLEQLNAVRLDLNGDGTSDDDGYYPFFPHAMCSLGCDETDGCAGYELDRDLDFDDPGSYANPTVNKPAWTDPEGEGWEPIGDRGNGFAAVFEGNGFAISNLFINCDTERVGLFGRVGSGGSVNGLGVVDGNVTGLSSVGCLAGRNHGTITRSYAECTVSSGRNTVGGLAGHNDGTITGSYAKGAVIGAAEGTEVGGLAGSNTGTITGSYTSSAVTGATNVGGLVGQNFGAITAAYATGPVSGETGVGGLVGYSPGTTTASYFDTATSGLTDTAGQTTSELQSPTGYDGIYANWNVDLDNADGDDMLDTGTDNPWDFGTALQYPALAVDFDGDGTASWQEFGYQLREGPGLTLTPGEGQVTLTWIGVDTTHWTSPPDVAYVAYRDGGERHVWAHRCPARRRPSSTAAKPAAAPC